MTIAIGDVHGKLEQYFKLINNAKKSFCVGDLGFKKQWDKLNPDYTQHKVVMGNHDYHPYRNTHPRSAGNWSFADGIFTVAGADSIDRVYRTEGVDWFANEELNYAEQLEAFDAYVANKPDVVISHDAPQSIVTLLFGYQTKSQTRTMLQSMFIEHEPRLWIFGHHHKSKRVKINRTEFVCLNELEIIEI